MNIDKIKLKIEDTTAKAYSKGKSTKDIIALKAEISTCEDLIKRSYSAIGRKYYEMYADSTPDPEFEKSMKEIRNAKKAIKEIEAKIEDIRNR